MTLYSNALPVSCLPRPLPFQPIFCSIWNPLLSSGIAVSTDAIVSPSVSRLSSALCPIGRCQGSASLYACCASSSSSFCRYRLSSECVAGHFEDQTVRTNPGGSLHTRLWHIRCTWYLLNVCLFGEHCVMLALYLSACRKLFSSTCLQPAVHNCEVLQVLHLA